MCALNFTKFRFSLAVKASFRPIYLELPLESPINMSINRNIIIFYSKLTCPTLNCYLNTVKKLPIQSETSSFNLRSGVLFSEERERKATRDSAVSRSVSRALDPPTLALLYFRVPPKKERLIAGYSRFVALVAMLTKITISILTTDNHQYTF